MHKVQSVLQSESVRLRRPSLCVSLLTGLIVFQGSFGVEDANQANAQQVARDNPAQSFSFNDLTIDRNKILAGGVRKDDIPAISKPKFITAKHARHVRPKDRVVGVTIDGEARAYPITILNHHEIINDSIRGTPVAVTFCPLCDSAVVFDRRTPIGVREFGVSGLLYNSNVLMYDRAETEGLWSQLAKAGVSGPGSSKTLKPLPLDLTTWQDWQTRHPNTTVLSLETGYRRNYRRNQYAQYLKTQKLMFPVMPYSDRFPAKMPVIGAWSGDAYKAYPQSAFYRSQTRIDDTLNGKKLSIEFSLKDQSMRIISADEGVHWMYAFWFAWYAFHPDTEVFGD